MSFTRVYGWASYRRLLPIIAAIQLMVLTSAWAQAPATVTTLAITPAIGQQASVAPGSVITLTAAVTAAGKPVIQGQVNFCDTTTTNYCTDVHLLGTAQLTSVGTAILRFVPGVGSHSYTAVFAGTGNLAPSTSTAALATVTGTYPTSTSLAATGVPGDYTLTATVVSAGGTLPPAGDVSFFDTTNANALLATQPLVPNSTHVTWNGIVESLPNEVVGFAVGDFNGDGKPDVIYPQFGPQIQPNQLAVLFGNGDGTFTPAPQTTSIGVNASQIVVGDFNNDGRQDVAIMYFTEQINNLSIFLGNGDGTFTLASTPAFGIDISNLAVGDFNGDGNEDLAETDGPQLNILFGNGDGTFTLGPPTTSVDFVNFAVGDFNKDGKLDLACAGQQLTILLGNGDGTFHEGVSLPGANYPVVADFNGDGILDIAGTVAVTDPTGPMDDGYVSIYLGAGDGSFTAAAPLPVLLDPRQIVVGDFNRDGKPDLAVPDLESNSNSTFIGNGDGTFTAANAVSSGADLASALAAADFNGDGAADLLTQYTGIGLAVYLSQPTMTSVATATGITVTGTGTHMVTANYPGEGLDDPSVSAPIGLTPLTDPTPVVTLLNLSAAPGSSTAYGQQVTLTATLSPYTAQGKITDGESVTFYSGRYAVGTAVLHSGIAALQLGTLPVGMNELTAAYNGDETFVASTSGVLASSVGGGTPATATTLTITADGQPVSTVASGKAVTLTASVLVNGTPLVSLGTFNFCEASAPHCADVNLLGSAQMTRAGTASFKFVPGIGSHSYKAVFLANASYAGSTSSPASLAVTGSFATTTTLTASGSVSDYTLTATTTGFVNAPGRPSPTGTVTFVDNSNQNTALATAALSTGTSTIDIATLAQVPAGTAPVAVAAADFNGDGIVDLAVAQDYTNTLIVLLGNGDGTFHPGVNPSIPAAGYVVAGDLNNDGIMDLVVSHGYSPLTVLLGVGDGTFTVLTDPSISNAFALALGDFNGDGILDLAITTGQDAILGNTPKLQILLGNGDGTFVAGQTISSPGTDPGITVGDFNGDGKLDFVVTASYLVSGSIFFGNGDGTFTPGPPTSPSMVGALTAGDFNGDGKTDLVGGEYGLMVDVWLSNGDGTFTPVPTSIPSVSLAQPPVVADFNHDGIADIAVDSGNAPATLFLGNGDGTLTQTTATFNSALREPAIADVNGDGLPDILVTNFGSANTVSVFLTQLTQTATATTTGISFAGLNTQSVTAAYPGDENYQGSTSGPVSLLSAPLPTSLLLNANPATSSTYGQPVTLTATLKPASSPVHSSDGELVTFTQGGNVVGTAALSGGVATITVSTLPAGSYSLAASFAGENYLAAATSIPRLYNVAAAAPTIKFSIPNHTYGDAPFAVMATSNSTAAITYTVVSGPATISGSTVTLTGAGTVTLQASQAASADYLAGTQQATFSVAQKAQSLSFAAPATPINYGAASIMLTATATSGLAVTFKVVSGSAVLSGSTLTIKGAGTVVVAADQAGNANYRPAVEVSHGIVVNQVAVAAVGLTAAPNPVLVQTAVTFTVAVSSPISTPSGSVVFMDGASPLGTSVLTDGAAALTVSTLAAGQHSITAAYSGDADFTPMNSPAVVESVQDFQVTSGGVPGSSQTIQPGGTATYTLPFQPEGGSTFPDAVSFHASGLPVGAVATFSQQTVPAGSGATNVTLTVQLPAQTARMKLNGERGKRLAGMALACALLPFMRRARQRSRRLSLLCIAWTVVLGGASFGGLLGCGGGSGSKSDTNPAVQTYIVTVTATSGQLSHSTLLTLTVD
jgi:hypothetical protein